MGETNGLVAEKAVDGSKADEPKVDESKVDESKASESQAAEPKPDEPKLDKPKVEEPKADESKVNESRIEQLLAVNRQLGLFFEEQLDTVLALRKSVAAIQGFIEGDPALKKKYEKYLQSAKEDEASPSDIHAASRIRGMLGQLQRTGTV